MFQIEGAENNLPEIKPVEIHKLTPLTQTVKHGENQSLLYDKDIIANVLKILSIDTDDTTNLVIKQSQVQIIKAITTLVETEWKIHGTHSPFLQFLSDEHLINDLFSFLQRNAAKPQLFSQNDLNLPIELLELSLT